MVRIVVLYLHTTLVYSQLKEELSQWKDVVASRGSRKGYKWKFGKIHESKMDYVPFTASYMVYVGDQDPLRMS